MINSKTRKRFNRIISGVLSAAMVMTMAPDIWLPVYAESVRNEIITADLDNMNEIIYDVEDDIEIDTDTDTASAPDGYYPISSEQPYFYSLRNDDTESKTQVLLIEDTYPWNSSANSIVLDSIGATYKKVKTSEFLSQDLGNYSLIVFANDQQFTAYNNYSTFKNSIETFAEFGGVVVFGACDAGWANGKLSAELPGGVSKQWDYDYYNYIDDYDHPIVTAELSDKNPLSDELLYSNYCSHDYFIESTLPKGSNVILRGSKSKAPTLVEYPYGKGHIIASGLTWEHNFNNHNNMFAQRVMDDLFLYALSIADIDVNMQPPIAVSVDAPQYLTASGNGYTPNPFDVNALLKNVSDESVNDVKAEIVLPDGLALVNEDKKIVDIGIMNSADENNILWQVKAVSITDEKVYSYKIIVTAENGYKKVVNKTIRVPMIEKTSGYAIFSGSGSQPLTLSGWKSNFEGDIYTGNNFIYNGSELYINGKIDAVGAVSSNGWKTEITETNDGAASIPMPDYDEAIEDNAQPYEYFEESPAYIQDRNIINSSIKVGGEVIISGTTFEGDCYIIAEDSITYNVQDFNSTGRVFLYSKNGNITINGSQININGAMYAPKGNVTFNTYDTTITGFVCADTINFNGSLFNITGANFDMVKPKSKGIIKTYTLDEDFNEGSFDGVSLAVPDQLILADKEAGEETALEKIYGDTENGKGVKVTLSSDKSILSENDDKVNIEFGLSGFGSADVNENAIDLILVVDESGSMRGSRMTNAKAAAKEVVSQMRDCDRCAVIGFTSYANIRQKLTNDKVLLDSAINNLRASGENDIYRGLKAAIEQFDNSEREKYIILISDGEDSTNSAQIAKEAGENGIRIFAMMIGTGTLQMQNIAINSNGIYKNAPTAADIGKIMSYFASEVFNVAGRNTTLRTTITDKNSIDINEITPEPANITENADGSVTLEWNLDRISIEDIKTINLPLSVTNSYDGFAELIQNSSCVYYDRDGKPNIIYIDDVILPVSKYTEKGNWSVVFDSKKDNVDWTHIYWNGKRFGDGKISVSASACNDGVDFGEPVSINNYEDISELRGRYVKLDVQLTASSDGKTPELFDITIMSKEADLPEYSNEEPTAKIISKNATKVNVPMNVRADISDDCLESDITVEWSSESGEVSFADNASLITNVSISETGSYEIICTVSDGENTVIARKTIKCDPADSYADIDPDKQEAPAPEISVDLPKYADRKQVINAKIENLNNTEISWYSVIFNGNTPVNVDDDGNFTLTMPNKDGTFPVVVRAFDWAGKSDVKEYEIIVDSSAPTISVTASAENVSIDEEAYFEINTTVESKIASIEYTLNDEAVTATDGKYILDTSSAGTYTLTANAVTTAGNTITASASITVEDTSEIDTEAPNVELSFDKEAYSVGDTIIAEIIAEDNIGVSRLEAFVNDEEVEIDENNCIKVENAAEGEYIFTANAYDEAGNMGTATYTVTIVMVDTEAPTVTITFDKDTYLERDDVIFIVTAEDNIGVTRTVVTVDGTEVTPDADGNYSIENAELKIYEITASAYDEAGNMGTATANVPVNEASAPVITVVFDKESYYEGDDLSALITAEGQREIKEIRVLVNGEEKSLDESGILTIENVVAVEYVFNITAEDVKGFTSECEKTVPVSPIDTEDKRLTAEIEPFVEYGETALLTIKITDDINAESVKAVLDDKEISLTDELTYEFNAEELFNHDFVITAQTNDGETIEKEVSVYVKDSVCPTMTITYDKPDGYYEGDDIIATIVAEDNVGIKRIEYTYDGVEYPIDENGNVTIPKIHVDTHAVVATAWDTFGNSITLTSAFIVVYDDVSGEDVIKTEDDVDDTELVCKIYTPKDGQTVTAPISIVGTAAGTEFKSYKLEYAPIGTKNYTLIKEGTEAVNANILGKLDPTLMNNGLYSLKLTVYSEKKNVSSEIVVSVEGNMKIGNFSIAFQDMDVNVAGLPLTVIRSYDSRSRNTKDDFGYGWDMSTSGVKINESCDMSSHWQVNMDPVGWGYYQYSITGKRAHIVTINFGNGKTEKFELEVVLPSPMSRPQYGVTLKFKPLNGSKSSLEIVGASTGNLFYDSNQIGSLSQLDVFRYAKYRFTKQDGTVYVINKNGEVESITEPNGSTITFNKDGIIHSDGKSIVFNRDKEDRITSIVSPTGKTVTYTYDENGDLSSVTDVSGEVTRFVYENHYLTEIIDPRGVRVSKNIYDDDGRLIKTIDADGNEIKYDHDINGREERVTDRNGNVTRYVYDQNGNILSQTDPNGNTVKNTYDSNGNISSKTDAMGNVTNYNYDSSGNMLSMTDAEGHSVSNSYNSKGQITSINAMGINTISMQYNDKGKLSSTTDALGNDINYSYDGKGQLTSVTDEIGTYMNMTYDRDGNVVSATNGAGSTAQFTYDSDGNCTSKTLTYASDGVMKTVTEQYFYDAAGNLTKIIDSDGNITITDYNEMGKISAVTDEKGRKTSLEYDYLGNLIGISYPDGTSERFTYDREGNNLTATDRMGRTVTMTYDKVGNLLSKTYPNGARVTYTYDANYNLVSETSASGGVTYYEYDKIGRNTAITDALGNRTAFFYNAKSQLESMTDPMGRVYTYIYDDNGNRIKTVYPDGSSVSSEYDARGRVTRQTDQHGYSTRYAYDGGDRLTGVTNAQGVTTSYAYDEVGNMTSVTDGNGNVTRYSYDDFGRIVKVTNALGNSAYTTYDNSGNVLTSTDYAGNITTYTYDNFDRVSSKTTPDGTVSYIYTTDGKLSSVTDNSGITMFTYDNMDGLTRVDYPDGSYVAYDYDNACRLTKVSTPFGTTSYDYDMLDRLTRVIDRNGYATIYEYDANGNRTAVRYANGLTVSYDYDLLNRLVRQETLDNDGEVVVQYIYTLGAAGERLSVAELGRTVEYTYDNLYRLTSETISEGENITAYTYAYDSVGNRILKTKNGTETVYTYNELNQTLSEDDTTYEYDLNGNVVRMISPTKSALYVYDSENRLVRATVQSGNNVSVEEYEYDYAGNRTAKKSEGGYTKYLLDINGSLAYVLAEMDYDGTEKCFYTRGTDLISQERDGKLSYYLTDGHGSVRALVNENGKVTDKYTYDAFGNLISSTGRTENDYLFAGEQFDPITGLYYLRARYMNPSVGTFISMDSYSGSIDDPVSLHKYLYANSNPVMYSDPSGNFAVLAGTLVMTAVSNYAQSEHDQAVLKLGMKIISGLSVLKDVINTVQSAFANELEGGALWAAILCGTVSSILCNFSCAIIELEAAGAIFAVGIGIIAICIGEAVSRGDAESAIDRTVQLISVIFSMFNPSCFTGDTPVYTDDGLVCIENIQVGDEVWAYNPETGETELKEVLNVWIKETDEILHVSTSDGETIDTTTNHPFYVDEKGWVAAGDLEIGDTLVTVDGDEVEVTDIEFEKLAEPILVYNIEVEDFHTYFVGEYGVLVHNKYKTNPNAKEYDVVDYGDNIKGAIGSDGKQMEKHHGILNKFLSLFMPGYDSNAAPAVVLSNSDHNATKSVYAKWANKLFGSFKVDWSKVTIGDMLGLSDDMFDAANVPYETRNEYYKKLTEYLCSLL